MAATSIGATLDRTEAFIISEGFRGFDPYDGLQSPVFRLPGLRSFRLGRWGFQQGLRRLPFQVRPLLGIQKGYNPVTLGLVLQALAYRRSLDTPELRGRAETIRLLVAELGRTVTPGYHGPCWGYDFDWQARHATIPAFHPTIVATGFVTNGLYEAHRLGTSPEAAELVVGAARFAEHDLNREGGSDTFCWSYSPTDHQQVLNASMKGVRLCAQAYALSGEEGFLDLARRAAAFVVARQREDGSWPYSTSDSRSWSDAFHTCYILDCLDAYEQLSGDLEFAEAKLRGYRFFVEHFFTDEGVVRYYHDRTFPIDATACGQALLTLCRFGDHARALRLGEWCLANLAHSDGSWKYRIYRLGANKLVYMRWSVAWMFLGLSALELLEASAPGRS